MNNISTLILYFFIGVLTSISAFLSIKIDKKYLRICFKILSIGVPSFFAGIRYNVGTDYPMYEAGFRAITEQSTIRNYVDFEIGYIWINRLVSLFGGNFNIVMFIMSLTTMIYIYKALLNESLIIDVGIGMFIYMFLYYLISFNLVRQSLAISICIYAITCLNKKKNNVFIFYVLLASLIHKSALVCLGILIVKFIFENRKANALKLIIFGVLLLCIIKREIIGDFVYYIYKNEYYAAYFTRQASVNANVLGYFLKNIPFIVCGLFCLKKILNNKQYSLYYNLMICGYIFKLLGYFTETQVHRIGFYFTYLSIIVLPFCIRNIPKKYKYIFNTSIIALVLSFWIFDFFYKGYSDVVPYTTIFDK